MSEVIVKKLEDEREWEKFLVGRPEACFLQSWGWGVFHEKLGNLVWRRGFYRDKKLAGVMLAITENAKRGRYLTVPGGPVIDWTDKSLMEATIEELKQIAGQDRDVFVRIRPQLEETKENLEVMKRLGLKPAPIHLHAELTHKLDLTKSEDELLAEMRKATRYEIRKAERVGVKVEATLEVEAMKEFYRIQLETAQRQNFTPFQEDFLTKQFEVFSKRGEALLYEARYEGELLAMAVIIFYGAEAVYHYGASTDLGRKYPGAYLIQWEAIKEARRRGKKFYNFWGVSPEGKEGEGHRFSGLSLFKRGFGGFDYPYLHAHDLVMDSIRYKVNEAVEIARKKIRRV